MDVMAASALSALSWKRHAWAWCGRMESVFVCANPGDAMCTGAHNGQCDRINGRGGDPRACAMLLRDESSTSSATTSAIFERLALRCLGDQEASMVASDADARLGQVGQVANTAGTRQQSLALQSYWATTLKSSMVLTDTGRDAPPVIGS
ncbi:uncharacterized protein LAESUDRAFT_724419 [Laetiporus sulphureus 93-53]|uniref:Uncharacterized protein n=1 Tax=Laetiporus sulphureus 93-53 TaxID=1314785 RepID=A0A165EXS3_9APHY|nr:uncharacterized protein LAESUDRAFT_724419 [Laetiporus sulphureus 93-53]KZT07938.1 hypothetical protein LAESUDRAFT_724419 [Laetiporus sulphureus 93-53]